MNNTVYPWQAKQWKQLIATFQQQRLPHALLFSGSAGSGKAAFAEIFAQTVLCQQTQQNGQSCGQCQSCQLLKAGSHPDYRLIKSNPDTLIKTIKIDDVRALSNWFPISAQVTEKRIVLIPNADQMNAASANALLKTLEEPLPDRYLILTSSQPFKLPATIRSRCQTIEFSLNKEKIQPWLQAKLEYSAKQVEPLLALANNAPLRALEIQQSKQLELRDSTFKHFLSIIKQQVDPVAVAAEWSKQKEIPFCEWLLAWTIDLIRLSYQTSGVKLYAQDLQKNLQLLLHEIHLKKLYLLYDELLVAQQLWQTQINKQMLLEKILIHCATLKI